MPYTFLDSKQFNKLLQFAQRLSKGKGNARFQRELARFFHREVVALQINREITPGLHYALKLVEEIVIERVIGKQRPKVGEIQCEADRKLLALIFGQPILNGELACDKIIDLYAKLHEQMPKDKILSLCLNCLCIIKLSQKVIDKIVTNE